MVSMDTYYTSPDLQIFVKVVRDRQAQKHPITVRSWSTIKDVKDAIQTTLQVPPSAQRLYYGPLLTSGGELPNHRSLHDAGIDRSGETLLLVTSQPHFGDDLGSTTSLRSPADICVSSSVIDSCPRFLRTVVQQARRGLALGLKPELVLDGSGGTYYLRDARKLKVGVFKPADEEPFAENNPRGYIKHIDSSEEALREGILPGEACLREVAAFLLDHGGFSGVPMTTLAEATHPTAFNTNGKLLKVSEGGASVGSHSLNPLSPAASSLVKKVGSLQEFVKSECTMDDLGPSKISVDEIHKIAILDIRLMNADRNAANILCKRNHDNSIELIPIDHGYGLRDVCDVSWMDWCWLDWAQVKEVCMGTCLVLLLLCRVDHGLTSTLFSFSVQPLSKKSLDYILNLDIDADAEILKEQLNISEKAIDYFRASSKLLQEGAKAGLSLYDIATMCCRNDLDGEIPSKLELLTSIASELANSAVENGRWHHVAASKALEDQLSPGSLLQHTKESHSGVFKSVSSINLVSFGVKNAEMPAMTQSTGSDTDSESVEDVHDGEDCDEWAAGIVRVCDVSLDHHQSMSILQSSLQTKPRSSSVTSEQSTDSPKGFWYQRPGSPPISSEESDTDSFSWSPNLSSTNIVQLVEDARALPSVVTQVEDKATVLTPTATFADSFSGAFRLPPPATVNVTTFKPVDGDQGSGAFAPMKSKTGLIRSKSYSALSDFRRSSTFSSTDSSRVSDTDQFRGYFNKMVDLVIVRETTSVAKA